MSPADTKTRILDAAEQLFARDGFHITSLRALTSLAQANLAAVNYHFGSKEALLQAVIERRLLPLNEIRRKKIEAVLGQAQEMATRPKVADLLRAFIEPTLAFRHSSPGAQDFVALIGRSLSEPDDTVRQCFIELVLPNFRLIFDSLQQALPTLPTNILLARLHFTLGAMSHVMCTSHRPPLGSPASLEPLDDAAQAEQFLTFAQAGLEAPQ